jgi:hydrogenase maturation factor
VVPGVIMAMGQTEMAKVATGGFQPTVAVLLVLQKVEALAR